ncbi:gliding motility lipoprotein GldH [Pedobacter cryophilus]|uniref:Gliding motility lipoprotein GldH n=1 Tax=Pedobacter cryophilus TaxID=2571271 RepID=A0A4U1C653_9SPHI|nr:gliding motility lipoprotein GldH [Pedobacter cryophilus]TKC00795.1 gliding motility lipoprotein GldH [Pedobacter cryophilus]
MNRIKKLALFCLTIMALQSCNSDTIIDSFESVPNQNWTYLKPVKASIAIADSTKAYNIYVNFRHTADYKYANIWLRFHVIGPDKKDVIERQEFQLALPDGEWLGKGSGSLYSYQLIYKENYKFKSKGTHTIVVEQNMRDNPLKGINDVGLKIEEAK